MFKNRIADEIKIKRYDRLEAQYITTAEYSTLQQMNTEYPTETRTLIEDVLRLGQVYDEDINKRFIAFFQDSTLQRVVRDAEKLYANMDDLNEGLTNAFRKLSEIFPEMSIPMVYAQIGAFDQSIIIKDGSIGISLDKYLGEDYPLYEGYFDWVQRKQMTRSRIIPDCVVFYLVSKYPLKDFHNASQEKRDEHIGKIFYITNVVVGVDVFEERFVKPIREYVEKHPDISLGEYLEEDCK
ncbi:MAG: gliding motility protein GldB [Bacteroidaceae bacterium]|nr:gliding motility protein GldB [Bacteroidaceae bacterium]